MTADTVRRLCVGDFPSLSRTSSSTLARFSQPHRLPLLAADAAGLLVYRGVFRLAVFCLIKLIMSRQKVVLDGPRVSVFSRSRR